MSRRRSSGDGPGRSEPAPRQRSNGTSPFSLSALVLNQSYEPLCIVSVKRAAVLLISKKAETVEHGDGYLRSTTTRIRTPAVVRLNRYIRIPRQVSSNPNRRGVFIRDNNACVYCGSRAETIDHVIPRSRGGKHSWDNVVAACAECNHRKSDRSLAELGWTLRRTPAPPSSWQLRGLSTHRYTDPRWATWLPPSPRHAVAA